MWRVCAFALRANSESTPVLRPCGHCENNGFIQPFNSHGSHPIRVVGESIRNQMCVRWTRTRFYEVQKTDHHLQRWRWEHYHHQHHL